MPYKIPLDIVSVQANVLRLFAKYGPMHDYDLIDKYRQDYNADVAESTPRTRRRELVDQGQVKKLIGLTQINRNGRELQVWGLA